MPTLKLDEHRVKVYMALRGISSVSELAELMGMHFNSVYAMINTGRFSIDSIVAMSKALNCNPIDLMVTPEFPAPNWEALALPSVA